VFSALPGPTALPLCLHPPPASPIPSRALQKPVLSELTLQTPQKYLLPHLQPPSTTSFQSTSASLSEQYDEAARLLSELQDQTTKLSESIEGDRERVNGVVGEVEEAVKGVREGEERWREEMREIRGEVESVRELVPRVGRTSPSPKLASFVGCPRPQQIGQGILPGEKMC